MSRSATVTLIFPKADGEELDSASRVLRHELEEAGIGDVQFKAVPEPDMAKAVGSFDVGTLIVTLASSGGVLTTLIGAIQSWANRQRNLPSITVEIGGDKLSIPYPSSRERQAIIRQWLKRHGDH